MVQGRNQPKASVAANWISPRPWGSPAGPGTLLVRSPRSGHSWRRVGGGLPVAPTKQGRWRELKQTMGDALGKEKETLPHRGGRVAWMWQWRWHSGFLSAASTLWRSSVARERSCSTTRVRGWWAIARLEERTRKGGSHCTRGMAAAMAQNLVKVVALWLLERLWGRKFSLAGSARVDKRRHSRENGERALSGCYVITSIILDVVVSLLQ
jgi:hypothetical protein